MPHVVGEGLAWLQKMGLFRTVLLPETLLGLRFHLLVNLSRGRVGPESPAKEQDMRLRRMDGVVLPAAALLHAHAPPFRLRQQPLLRERLCELFRENHVPGAEEEKGPN